MGDPEKVVPETPRLPRALYVLPLVTVLVLAVSIFSTSGNDEIRSALVLGGPTDAPEFRGRLLLTRERGGVSEAVPSQEVIIEARQGQTESVVRTRTDDTGWVEFSVERKFGSPLFLAVTDAAGTNLAQGPVDLSTKRWASSARRRGDRDTPRADGVLVGRVRLDNRVLSVPFPARGTIILENDGRPWSDARVRLSATGASLASSGPEALLLANERGEVPFLLSPYEHVVSLRVIAEGGEERLEFAETLPVVPGSFSFERRGDGIAVYSPVPREDVWFTFVREDERLRGGRLKMKAAEGGTTSARIPLADVPSGKGLYLVLASEADGRSPSTVGYPLDDQASTFDAWDAYLLDGAPAERMRATRASRRVRWVLAGYAALCSLLTLVLFVTHVRRSDRLLDTRLKQAGVSPGAESPRTFPLAIAVLSLFFAFSLGVLWIVAR